MMFDKKFQIREHFLSLARKPVPASEETSTVTETNRSLIQMGGTKKRKRESSLEDNTGHPPSTSVQTTVPNLNTSYIRGRKRKSGELPQDDSPNKIQKPNKRNQWFSKKNKNKNKGKNKKDSDGVEDQDRRWIQGQQDQKPIVIPKAEVSGNPSGFKEENNSFHIDKTGDKNVGNGNRRGGGFRGRYRGRKRNAKAQGDNRQNNTQRQSQEFAPYDYSSVDFRQFQGGAEVAPKQRQFKSSFKFKVCGLFCCSGTFFL